MPHAGLATIRPPAILRTGSEMPKKCKTKRPKKRKVTRMTNTQTPVFKAVRWRSLGDQEEVMVKNMGTPPKGSTMGKRARNVAAAEWGSVRRNWPSAWVAFMGSAELERIDNLDTEMLKIFLVSRGHYEPVNPCGCGNHSVFS